MVSARVSDKFYPSKILLFGEHTVLQGSQALAMPFDRFGGVWKYTTDFKLQYDLPKFIDYLKKLTDNGELSIDTEGVTQLLNNGLYFDSNIPRGYGAGSSGALVAAIYDCFGVNKSQDLAVLKSILGKMESYFHGSSSGFDPLISYINKPILIKKDKTMDTLPSVKNDLHLFLIDTHIPRKAENLIKIFADRCQALQYNELVVNELVPYINDAVSAFLNNMPSILFESVHNISYFQYKYFPEAVPLAYKNAWLEGLSSDIYKLKLCGAGGGGFILGFCKNWEETQSVLLKSGFPAILVN